MDQRAHELAADYNVELASILQVLDIPASALAKRAGLHTFNIIRYLGNDEGRTIKLPTFFGLQVYLGQELRSLRERAGWDRQAVASMVGASPDVIQLIEDGLVYHPALLRSLANSLKSTLLEKRREERLAARQRRRAA